MTGDSILSAAVLAEWWDLDPVDPVDPVELSLGPAGPPLQTADSNTFVSISHCGSESSGTSGQAGGVHRQMTHVTRDLSVTSRTNLIHLRLRVRPLPAQPYVKGETVGVSSGDQGCSRCRSRTGVLVSGGGSVRVFV